MSDESCLDLSYRWVGGVGNANVAFWTSVDPVGEWSVSAYQKTLFSMGCLGVSESVTRPQVPPRPPK